MFMKRLIACVLLALFVSSVAKAASEFHLELGVYAGGGKQNSYGVKLSRWGTKGYKVSPFMINGTPHSLILERTGGINTRTGIEAKLLAPSSDSTRKERIMMTWQILDQGNHFDVKTYRGEQSGHFSVGKAKDYPLGLIRGEGEGKTILDIGTFLTAYEQYNFDPDKALISLSPDEPVNGLMMNDILRYPSSDFPEEVVFGESDWEAKIITAPVSDDAFIPQIRIRMFKDAPAFGFMAGPVPVEGVDSRFFSKKSVSKQFLVHAYQLSDKRVRVVFRPMIHSRLRFESRQVAGNDENNLQIEFDNNGQGTVVSSPFSVGDTLSVSQDMVHRPFSDHRTQEDCEQFLEELLPQIEELSKEELSKNVASYRRPVARTRVETTSVREQVRRVKESGTVSRPKRLKRQKSLTRDVHIEQRNLCSRVGCGLVRGLWGGVKLTGRIGWGATKLTGKCAWFTCRYPREAAFIGVAVGGVALAAYHGTMSPEPEPWWSSFAPIFQVFSRNATKPIVLSGGGGTMSPP